MTLLCDTDRVFAPACSTQKVYDEGAKDVALSALSGINGNLFLPLSLCISLITALLDLSNNFNFLAATIFAYGQTSSGKTFTMRGITENAIRDIYDYIKNVSDC
jgi:centromeric protein E